MCPSGSVFDSGFVGLMFYFVGNLIVLTAVVFGMEFVTLCTGHHDARAIVERDVSDAMAAWDGVWYQRIASDGYSYDPERMSNIAFFPLFPMTARCVAKVTGLRMHDAMLLTSHGFLMAAFWIAGVYLHKRAKQRDSGRESQFVLLAMAVYPTTFYLRMSYSESSFLCASLLAMLGMVCRWPTLAIAMIIGVATAARSVGVALILPFLWHLWCERKSTGRFLYQAALLMPVCVSGLAAFMIFQWQAFGDPLAFVKAHRHWYERIPPESYWDRIVAHVTLEPLWRVYDPTSHCCWSHEPPTGFPLFSMQFMNPIFVLASWIAIGWGAYRIVLSGKEVWLSLGLLAIPYLTHNYRSCCTAEGRLASVIFPFYIVLGFWLSHLPQALSTGLIAIMSILLAAYTALFIQWYWFY